MSIFHSITSKGSTYSGKFSRGPIFTVFTDDHLTLRIKPAKINGKDRPSTKMNPTKICRYVVEQCSVTLLNPKPYIGKHKKSPESRSMYYNCMLDRVINQVIIH